MSRQMPLHCTRNATGSIRYNASLAAAQSCYSDTPHNKFCVAHELQNNVPNYRVKRKPSQSAPTILVCPVLQVAR